MKLDDDDFSLFGLPQRQTQDRAAIDASWKALQAQVHPDRFAAQGAAAQRLSAQWAMRVNEAHQRLRDPLKRAAYLCELRGVPLQIHENTRMPTAFLMEQMAWREALDEAQGLTEVEALDAEVATRERELLAEVQGLLDADTDMAAATAAAAAAATAAAAQQVRALMFIHRFRSDLDRRLEALGQ